MYRRRSVSKRRLPSIETQRGVGGGGGNGAWFGPSPCWTESSSDIDGTDVSVFRDHVCRRLDEQWMMLRQLMQMVQDMGQLQRETSPVNVPLRFNPRAEPQREHRHQQRDSDSTIALRMTRRQAEQATAADQTVAAAAGQKNGRRTQISTVKKRQALKIKGLLVQAKSAAQSSPASTETLSVGSHSSPVMSMWGQCMQTRDSLSEDMERCDKTGEMASEMLKDIDTILGTPVEGALSELVPSAVAHCTNGSVQQVVAPAPLAPPPPPIAMSSAVDAFVPPRETSQAARLPPAPLPPLPHISTPSAIDVSVPPPAPSQVASLPPLAPPPPPPPPPLPPTHVAVSCEAVVLPPQQATLSAAIPVAPPPPVTTSPQTAVVAAPPPPPPVSTVPAVPAVPAVHSVHSVHSVPVERTVSAQPVCPACSCSCGQHHHASSSPASSAALGQNKPAAQPSLSGKKGKSSVLELARMFDAAR